MFRTFSRRFGHKFKATYEDSKARDLWLRDLKSKGISDEQIRFGLDACVELEWPPSVGEFIRWCKPRPEQFGIPDVDTAYREAAKAVSVGWGEHTWSHPMIYHAARSIETFEWKNLGDRVLRPMFERAYQILASRVMAGESFDAPIPKALPPKVIVRTSDDKAKEYIANMRQGLRGGLDV